MVLRYSDYTLLFHFDLLGVVECNQRREFPIRNRLYYWLHKLAVIYSMVVGVEEKHPPFSKKKLSIFLDLTNIQFPSHSTNRLKLEPVDADNQITRP